MSLPDPARYARDAAKAIGADYADLDQDGGYLFRVSRGGREIIAGAGGVCSFPVNSATAFTLSRDKAHTKAVLAGHELKVIPGGLFFAHQRRAGLRGPGREVEDARAFAKALGYPVFAKPNQGSRGNFAEIISDDAGLVDYTQRVAVEFESFLIEPVMRGAEHRVLIHDGNVVFHAVKQAPALEGDGARTAETLLDALNAELIPAGISAYPRGVLDVAGVTPVAVLARGQRVLLPGRRNLSAVGEIESFSDTAPPVLADIARRAVTALGLRIGAVDLFDISLGNDLSDLVVIEVNANPGLKTLELAGREDLIRKIWVAMLEELLGGGAMMFGLPKFGDGIGLHRIRKFFREHGVDESALSRKSVVIVGSNGKGSTSRFLQTLLGAGGKRVGLFTSPHMFDFTERFLIGDERIARDAFDRFASVVLAFNDRQSKDDRLGAFEFLFLVAILWFGEQKPDWIVWEAGIGGRYDPVRAIRAKVVGLAGIELEHTQLLGPTEELIAYDKIDALAPEGTLICSPGVPAKLNARIAEYCALTGRNVALLSERLEIGRLAIAADGMTFEMRARSGTWPPATLRLSLLGRHQAMNAVTALALARTALGQALDLAPTEADRARLAATRWAGRLEKVAGNPDLWIDVGHTPQAVDLVTEAFLNIAPREKTLVVFGVSASKEVAAIATMAASRFDHFILTRAHKSGADVATFSSAFAGKDVTIAPDTAEAARLAKARAEKDGLTVLALGGLFLAAETQFAWQGGDAAALDFF